jgi:hypothetical protein
MLNDIDNFCLPESILIIQGCIVKFKERSQAEVSRAAVG